MAPFHVFFGRNIDPARASLRKMRIAVHSSIATQEELRRAVYGAMKWRDARVVVARRQKFTLADLPASPPPCKIRET